MGRERKVEVTITNKAGQQRVVSGKADTPIKAYQKADEIRRTAGKTDTVDIKITE